MNNRSIDLNTDMLYNDAKRFYLSSSKDVQNKTICNHYIKLLNITQTLYELLQFKEEYIFKNADFKQLDEQIDYLIDKIKKEHQTDFGIKLEWENND